MNCPIHKKIKPDCTRCMQSVSYEIKQAISREIVLVHYDRDFEEQYYEFKRTLYEATDQGDAIRLAKLLKNFSYK